MTDFKKWKLALISGLAVPALALTACSSDDGDSSDSSATESGSASDSVSDTSSDVTFEGAPDGFELTAPGEQALPG